MNDSKCFPMKLASYEYGPFGELVSKSGFYVDENTYKFSTKPIDVETGYYYYGYRYYDSSNGRWLNRDPIGELGGFNIYGFVENDGINWVDSLGLEVFVGARGLNSRGGNAAVHTFVQVRSGNTNANYGGYKNGDKLAVRKNDPSDAGTPNKGFTKIPPPPGMSQADWDKAVTDSGKRELNKSNKREYKALGGDGGKKSGNCNSTTSDIIEGAGGSLPKGYDPPGYNPGLRVP